MAVIVKSKMCTQSSSVAIKITASFIKFIIVENQQDMRDIIRCCDVYDCGSEDFGQYDSQQT